MQSFLGFFEGRVPMPELAGLLEGLLYLQE